MIETNRKVEGWKIADNGLMIVSSEAFPDVDHGLLMNVLSVSINPSKPNWDDMAAGFAAFYNPLTKLADLTPGEMKGYTFAKQEYERQQAILQELMEQTYKGDQ